MKTISNESTLSILIVDDHAVVREGLRRVLESTASNWTVVEAEGGFQALEFMRQQPFDLAVVDLSMPGMTGLELLRRVKTEYPRLKLLILSMHAEEQYAMRAFRAGANGYVTKDSAALELAVAVRRVASGGAYVSSALAESMVLHMNGAQEAPSYTQLSDRELDVFRRLISGERPTAIAQALHLSVKTVSTHKSRIQTKLQLPTTAALIRYGVEHGLGTEDVLGTPEH